MTKLEEVCINEDDLNTFLENVTIDDFRRYVDELKNEYVKKVSFTNASEYLMSLI